MRPIGAESDHLEPLISIAPVDRIEGRHLLTAGRAPASPEAHYDHLSALLREIKLLATQLLYNQRRCRLTDGCRGKREPGCEDARGDPCQRPQCRPPQPDREMTVLRH